MAIALGARANNKNVTISTPVGSGARTILSGAAVSIPAFTIVVEGVVPDVSNPFGASAFSNLIRFQNAATNPGAYLQLAVTVGNGQTQFRCERTDAGAKVSLVTLPSGTLANLLRGQRFTYAAHMSASRVVTTTIVYGEAGGTGTTLVQDSTPSAYSAGVGLLEAITAIIGAVTNSWPGDVCHSSLLNTALSVADVQAIHAARDPGYFFHTHRTSVVWSATGFLKGEPYSTTDYPLPGQTPTANNIIVYDSGDPSPNWFPSSDASSGTVAIGAGTIGFSRPTSIGYTVDQSIVPQDVYDLVTEVQNRAVNPALYDLGRGVYRKATHIKIIANSRGERAITDPENRQTQNTTYDSSQPASIGQNWAEGIGGVVPGNLVGISRRPHTTTNVASFSAWTGASPATGTVGNRTGTGANDAYRDFCRVSNWRQAFDAGYGPGQYLAISPNGGIDQLFSACGGIQPTDPVRVWVCFQVFPNSASATIQKVSHASSSSTVPFGSAAANWASGTEHGSQSSAITLSNSIGDSPVVSYSSGSLVVLADPGIHVGEAVVVSVGGVECLGIVESTDGAGNISTEHDMGGGTGVPAPGDTAYFGGAIGYHWAYVDFDGTETPNAWRGVRIRAGATGFPVHVLDLIYQKLDASGNPAPGLIVHPHGWSGNSYAQARAAFSSTVFATSEGGDGLNTYQRMVQAWRVPMEFGGSTYSQKCVVLAPAQQTGTPADTVQFFDDFDTTGWKRSEQSYWGDPTNIANTTTMAAQAYQEWSAYGLTVGPARGIVAIQNWRTMGVPFTQVANGWRSDNGHFSTSGVVKAGTEWKRVLAPVSAGGGGAALPARSGGGYRNRPSRARLAR